VLPDDRDGEVFSNVTIELENLTKWNYRPEVVFGIKMHQGATCVPSVMRLAPIGRHSSPIVGWRGRRTWINPKSVCQNRNSKCAAQHNSICYSRLPHRLYDARTWNGRPVNRPRKGQPSGLATKDTARYDLAIARRSFSSGNGDGQELALRSMPGDIALLQYALIHGNNLLCDHRTL
jgi:hypothetical protein